MVVRGSVEEIETSATATVSHDRMPFSNAENAERVEWRLHETKGLWPRQQTIHVDNQS